MKRIILFIMVMALVAFGQQTNYTFGQKTDGTKYTQTGTVDVDSITTYSIVIDFQDYYRAADDTYGVLFLYVDAENSTDSVNYRINFRNGGYAYHPNDDSRLDATNVTWADDTTAIQATSKNLGDVKWVAHEIAVSGQMYPPEFGRIDIKFLDAVVTSNDSMDVKAYFVYQSVYEEQQRKRNVNSDRNSDSYKEQETLH